MIKDFWQIKSIYWNEEHTDVISQNIEYEDEDQANMQLKIIQALEKEVNPKYLAVVMDKVFFCEICQEYNLQYISSEIFVNFNGINIPIVYCKHNTMDEILEHSEKKLHGFLFEMN